MPSPGLSAPVHVDWLTAWQEHEACPSYGSVLRLDVNPETGQVEIERMLGVSVERPLSEDVPSRVSHLRVRAHNGVVEVSGNPSKWGRLDAVSHGVDICGAYDVYNRVLADLGLPIFSGQRWLTGDDAASETVRLGARLSRLDLAQVYSCGDAAGLRGLMDWLPSQRLGRRGHSWTRPYPGYCKAGTPKRVQAVCYDKGDEVREAAKGWARHGEAGAAEAGYLNRLADWATDVGLVRWEIRLGSKWLSEHGRNRWVDWREGDEAKIMGEVAQCPSSPGASCDWRGFRQAFEAAGLAPRLAAQREAAVLSWISGGDPLSGYGRAMRYRIQRQIRDVLGFDLRNPPDVRAISTRVSREISVLPVQMPDWYRRAAIPPKVRDQVRISELQAERLSEPLAA